MGGGPKASRREAMRRRSRQGAAVFGRCWQVSVRDWLLRDVLPPAECMPCGIVARCTQDDCIVSSAQAVPHAGVNKGVRPAKWRPEETACWKDVSVTSLVHEISVVAYSKDAGVGRVHVVSVGKAWHAAQSRCADVMCRQDRGKVAAELS